MKGNPFQRNFGIGSPMNKNGDPKKPKGEKGEKTYYDYPETEPHTKDEEIAFTGAVQGVTTGKEKHLGSYKTKSDAHSKERFEKEYREGLEEGPRRRYDKAMASGKERKIGRKLGKREEAYTGRGMSQEQASKYTAQDLSRVTKPKRTKK